MTFTGIACALGGLTCLVSLLVPYVNSLFIFIWYLHYVKFSFVLFLINSLAEFSYKDFKPSLFELNPTCRHM